MKRLVLKAGLVAGTLDISAASIQTLLYGRNPLNMLKFVASGVFGSSALSGGLLYSLAGLFFHYVIAFSWTILFFQLYPKVSLLKRNLWLTAVLYGLFVWTVMNLVVLPLSNTPEPNYTLKGFLIGASILILCIGLPLAIFARRLDK